MVDGVDGVDGGVVGEACDGDFGAFVRQRPPEPLGHAEKERHLLGSC